MSHPKLALYCLLATVLLATGALGQLSSDTTPVEPAPATDQARTQNTSPRAAVSLPPGHPPADAAAATQNQQRGLPPGHPPTGPAEEPAQRSDELPPGHPPTDSGGGQAHVSNAHAETGPAKDQAIADSSIPKGKVIATIVNANGQPLSGTEVRLATMFQSIAQGDERTFQTKTTNLEGNVEFGSLETESNFSYRITVRQGAAEYASAPFQLQRDKGQRVLLHVYPATSDIKQAQIAMRGLVYVQPRDDVFQFEVWFQVFNVSQLAWVPKDVSMGLPEGAKAFTARESMTDTRFEATDAAQARLLGTFPPGQHDVRFAFQVANAQSGSADFRLSLPPNVAEFRVITEASKGMTLNVNDFPAVQSSTGMQGERVLVSQKRGTDLNNVRFQIAGLPTRGSAPWLAVMIAALTAASGLYSARNSATPNKKRRRQKEDLKAARKVIVRELTELELARNRDQIGPKSYEQTRRTLINALARII